MKAKVLFMALHRPGRSPSQRFRFEQYLGILRAGGYACDHAFLLDARADRDYYAGGRYFQKLLILIKSTIKLAGLAFFGKYDMVFVQREAFMLGTSFFERQFAKKSKLIFDFDDTIWRHQTGKIKSKNKIFYSLKNPEKTISIIKAAYMVIAGNAYLSGFAKNYNRNVRIIPTTIDTQAYPFTEKTNVEKVAIGWSGSFSTIIHFEFILGALERLKEKYGDKVCFKVIGDETFRHQKLNIRGLPWRKDSEIQNLSEFDIGIMPLPDDEWTKGKCGLKGLQYMALGIPTIMSPVGVNADIIQDGVNGYLADKEDEWVEKASLLVDSPELRKSIGLKGRKTVEKHYSVEANKARYLEIFDNLIKTGNGARQQHP